MTLKQLRKSKQLTQAECARYLGIPLRTYQNYESDAAKAASMKYAFMMEKLRAHGYIDETHGLLSVSQIRDICAEVFRRFDVEYCYLFGSYAKGTAAPDSDVDLLLATSATGMQFFDLVETLRESLKKKVDVLSREQLTNNPELINEILKDGVRIYG